MPGTCKSGWFPSPKMTHMNTKIYSDTVKLLKKKSGRDIQKAYIPDGSMPFLLFMQFRASKNTSTWMALPNSSPFSGGSVFRQKENDSYIVVPRFKVPPLLQHA